MSTYKRKRDFSSKANVLALYRPVTGGQKRRKQTFVPGASRTAGYYGRFSGTGGELKFHDRTLDDDVVSDTGTVTSTLNEIAQGVTESQRIGRKCTLKVISWRWSIELPIHNSVSQPIADSVRIILFVDKQANGDKANVTDLLETAKIWSFRNLANQMRFNIVLDRVIDIEYPTISLTEAGSVFHAPFTTKAGGFYKKCSIPIEFSGTTGSIGEIRSNNLSLLLISRSGVATFKSEVRVRFSDS